MDVNCLAASIFDYQSVNYLLILILVALFLGVYLIRYGRKKGGESRADRLQREYAVLDIDKLEHIPDGELVDAVIANMIAGLDPKMPDDYKEIPLLSPGQCAVYSIWLTCSVVKKEGLEVYLGVKAGRFAELAVDGFKIVGAYECASVMSAVNESDISESDIHSLEQQLHSAIEREKPLDLCRLYIRSNPEEFIDQELIEEESGEEFSNEGLIEEFSDEESGDRELIDQAFGDEQD